MINYSKVSYDIIITYIIYHYLDFRLYYCHILIYDLFIR